MNETLKTIHEMHSTHMNFTDQPIRRESLDEILAASIRAANASNRQSYSIVIVEGADTVSRVAGFPVKAPVALIYLVDFTRIKDVGDHLGYETGHRTAFAYLTAHTDAALAMQTAVIAAASLGINSLITNSVINPLRKNMDELYADLKLPDNGMVFPIAALLLGYEDAPREHASGRLDGPGVIHQGTYHRIAGEEAAAIAARMNDPANHFGAGSGDKTYLDVYYQTNAAPKTPEIEARIDGPLKEKLRAFFHTGE